MHTFAHLPHEATRPARTATAAGQTPTDAIDANIAALIRAGGLDAPECAVIAIEALAFICRIGAEEAAIHWNRYTA